MFLNSHPPFHPPSPLSTLIFFFLICVWTLETRRTQRASLVRSVYISGVICWSPVVGGCSIASYAQIYSQARSIIFCHWASQRSTVNFLSFDLRLQRSTHSALLKLFEVSEILNLSRPCLSVLAAACTPSVLICAGSELKRSKNVWLGVSVLVKRNLICTHMKSELKSDLLTYVLPLSMKSDLF